MSLRNLMVLCGTGVTWFLRFRSSNAWLVCISGINKRKSTSEKGFEESHMKDELADSEPVGKVPSPILYIIKGFITQLWVTPPKGCWRILKSSCKVVEKLGSKNKMFWNIIRIQPVLFKERKRMLKLKMINFKNPTSYSKTQYYVYSSMNHIQKQTNNYQKSDYVREYILAWLFHLLNFPSIFLKKCLCWNV